MDLTRFTSDAESVPVRRQSVTCIVKDLYLRYEIEVLMCLSRWFPRSNRFMRSDRAVDRLLTTRSDWTPFEAVWIAPQFVRTLTVNGSDATSRRTLRHPSKDGDRPDRRAPLSPSHIA